MYISSKIKYFHNYLKPKNLSFCKDTKTMRSLFLSNAIPASTKGSSLRTKVERHYTTVREFRDKFDIERPIKNRYKELILHSPHYGDILKDPELIFHGINNDISKILSIFKHGIVSASKAQILEITSGHNHGLKTPQGIKYTDNDSDYVNIARSPVHYESAGHSGGAFGSHIKNSIAFVIKPQKPIDIYSRRTGVQGGGFVFKEIPPIDIVGMILPKLYLSKNITEISFIIGAPWLTFPLRCRHFYQFINSFCEISDEPLIKKIDKIIEKLDWEDIQTELDSFIIQGLSKKLKKKAEEISFLEVIQSIVPKCVPLYDSYGQPFEQSK